MECKYASDEIVLYIRWYYIIGERYSPYVRNRKKLQASKQTGSSTHRFKVTIMDPLGHKKINIFLSHLTTEKGNYATTPFPHPPYTTVQMLCINRHSKEWHSQALVCGVHLNAIYFNVGPSFRQLQWISKNKVRQKVNTKCTIVVNKIVIFIPFRDKRKER